MRRSLTILSLIAASTLAVAAGPAPAGGRSLGSALTPVTVVMHDPGCHWFSVNGAFKRRLVVKGPVQLTNFDMSALTIAGNARTKQVGVGKKVVLRSGAYLITMVRQASDDNTLQLVVK